MNLIFLHGKKSSGQGHKASFLRELFPGLVAPDFHGSLDERMTQLDPILTAKKDWIIIGSSMGGLMATQYAQQYPEQVQLLILLAPAFKESVFGPIPTTSITIPTTIYHGWHDTTVPIEPARQLILQIFRHLTFHAVDDDHRLHKTIAHLNWRTLVKKPILS